ncbi:MAG: hypothetical protein V2I97_08410 [Desulfococcaceae bacterium]|jgi:hypothetical protein|nr:hypothetical protein [Desulfococcaceae bacterium]
MAGTSGEHIENLIAQAQRFLSNVTILRHESSRQRAIIDFEGNWKEYRIIVSEIHRINRRIRYAYYVLDKHHAIVHAFDNSPDNKAIKQKYGSDWKCHIYEEVSHQHDSENKLSLTELPITFEAFVQWAEENL